MSTLGIDNHDPSIVRRWELARKSFYSGDHAGALYQLKALEKDGVEDVIVDIGNIYEIGKGGIEQDLEKAKYWYEQAIKKTNDPIAHLFLARVSYRLGNYGMAHECLNCIKDEPQPGIFYILGQMYMNGLGVEKNVDKAIEYFKRAEELDHITASFVLGWLMFKRCHVIGGLKRMLKAFITATKYSTIKTEHWRLQVGWMPKTEK